MTQKRKRSGLDFSVYVTTLAGALFVALLLSHTLSWRDTAQSFLPLMDDLSTVNLSLSQGHLDMIEALRGESDDLMNESKEHFASSISALDAALAKESTFFETLSHLPPDTRFRVHIDNLRDLLEKTERANATRWKYRNDLDKREKAEREFEVSYSKALRTSEIIENLLTAVESRELAYERKRFVINAIAVVVIFLLGSLYLFIQLKRRSRIEDELTNKEKRFIDIAESAGDWIWETDKEGRYTYANRVVERIMGYSPEEVIGKDFLDFFAYSGAALVADATRQFFQREKPFSNYPTVQSHKDGTLVSLEAAGIPLFDEEGNFSGYRGVTRNVTQRVKAEETIRQGISLLDSINNAQASIIADENPKETFDNLLDDILALTKSAFGFIGETLYDENKVPYLRLLTITNIAWDETSEELFSKIAIGKLEFRNPNNLVQEVIKTGRVVIANDAPNDARRGGTPSGHPNIKRYMGLPLFKGNQLMGVAGIANRRTGYDEDLARFLEPFLSTCANIISATQSEKMRKRVEGELDLVSKILKNANEGVIITDENTRMIMVNPAVTKITGYKEEELIGRTPRILQSKRHDKEFYKNMWDSLKESGKWEGEIWNRQKSGEAYPEWLSITAVNDARGKVTKYIGTFHDITELHISKERLKYTSDHDALTELPNRRLFEDRLGQSLASVKRRNVKLGVMFLSLDRFKKVNESLGHTAGDRILQTVAKRLSEALPEYDTIARWGGDEFVFILRDAENIQDLVNTTAKMVDKFSEPFVIEEQELYLTASVGVATYPSSGEDVKTITQAADIAMKRAKEHGGNNFQIYSSSMESGAYEAISIEQDLRKALERGEMVVYYQPKVDVESCMVVGMEALVRWKHATKGIISPVKFIPLAEETGLIVPIGEKVLEDACLQTKKWLDAGFSPLAVSVNLSALQFAQSDLQTRVEAILEETGLPPEYLDLEITEGTVMGDVENAIVILQKLSDMGISVSIDDFGTGYSSLSYLKRFPLNTLKVDRSFVSDITTNPDDAAIAETIILMAHNLNLKVVAEGVETFEQFDFLKKRKCDQIQGFLFSKPLDAHSFEKMLVAGDMRNSTGATLESE